MVWALLRKKATPLLFLFPNHFQTMFKNNYVDSMIYNLQK